MDDFTSQRDTSPYDPHQAAIDAQIEQAMADRQRERASSAPPPPKQAEPAPTVIRRRTDNLRAALNSARNRDTVLLPELTRNNPTGEQVRLRVRRLTIQELAASNTLPQRADLLVSKLIDQAMAATQGPRADYGLTADLAETDVQKMIQDTYGGWNREAFAAFFEFQCAVCCAAVIDDDYRLYMTPEEVEADPERGVLVWEIPDTDLDKIFTWVLEQEDRAEGAAIPFRDGRYAADAVQPGGQPEGQAERPDRV